MTVSGDTDYSATMIPIQRYRHLRIYFLTFYFYPTFVITESCLNPYCNGIYFLITLTFIPEEKDDLS